MQAFRTVAGGPIEVLPLVVVAQAFPARPSSLPGIREFVRRQLGHNVFTEDDIRVLTERLLDLLLEVAGPTGTIQVSLRIFPDYAEIDVLPAKLAEAYGDAVVGAVPANGNGSNGNGSNGNGSNGNGSNGNGSNGGAPDRAAFVSFAEWLGAALRRENMTMEAAARQLRVSVKTVSRWVGGTTEPRLRDLSRIREIFGDLPFP